MRARALVAAILLAGAARTAGAQSTAAVYGTVKDPSGRPILNAQVRVLGTTLVSLSGHDGGYVIAGISPDEIVLSARFIGYYQSWDTLRVAAGDSVRVDFTLRPSPVRGDDLVVTTLPPVVVTAAKRSQLLDQAVTSVALMDQTQIARRAVVTVDEAVDKAPGVQFLNGQVNIRGSSGYVQGLGARVLLLIDGVPANQGDRGGINWDILPLDDVDRVEILKGAGSSLYGSAALGGVVNLITREIAPGWHARVRTTGGVLADPPHDVWKFRDYTGAREGLDVAGSYGTAPFSGSYTVGGWHSDGYREQDRQNHWQTGGKGEWRPAPETRVTASGSWSSDQYQSALMWCVRPPAQCDDRGQAYQPFMIDTSGLGSGTRSDKGYLTATVERTPSPRLSWLARGSWLRTHFTDFQPKEARDDWGVANRFGAELRGEANPAPDRVVTVGAEAARSDVETNIFTGDTSTTSNVIADHSQTELAAYGESEQRFGRARLTAGARLDYLAVDGGGWHAVVSPRVGGVITTDRGAWRASLGRGFRAPSLAERFVSTEVAGLRVVPNPSLGPETAWSFELGNVARWSETVHSDAALFWTEAYDLIEPNVDLLKAQIQFQNVARARLAGLDLALGASPFTPQLAVSLAYTFLYSRELAHGTVPEQPLAFRPKHLLTLGADYTWRAFGLGADFRYTSRFERVELYPDDPRVAPKVFDLRASWQRRDLSVRLLVGNALNYIYNLVPRTLAPVRTVTVTATWTY
ncbi:MAG: hypothetical protein AUH42_06805 [Gemmatimonadetes bacterium 13_1_40CM_70_11]|nr:MAG: hypothetical protein AUH42_06805 [Gemmatimonadetes bacterium 13_1_40CM_70_11]